MYCKLKGTPVKKVGEYGFENEAHQGCKNQCFDCMADVGERMRDGKPEYSDKTTLSESGGEIVIPNISFKLGSQPQEEFFKASIIKHIQDEQRKKVVDSLRYLVDVFILMDKKKAEARAMASVKPKPAWQLMWCRIKRMVQNF